jgi:tetratricopeptide (TPR) repeat protein
MSPIRPILLGAALAAGLLAAPAGAAERCPPPEERAEDRDRLLDALAGAETEAEGRALGDALRHLWAEAPDARAQALIDRVFERRRAYDFAAAEEAARAVVAYCPDFAEGWNQLATVLFERGRLDASLDVIPKVLALEPKHFGALSGRALILMRQGRARLGQKALREALAVHPWLAERGMLIEVPGEDL